MCVAVDETDRLWARNKRGQALVGPVRQNQQVNGECKFDLSSSAWSNILITSPLNIPRLHLIHRGGRWTIVWRGVQIKRSYLSVLSRLGQGWNTIYGRWNLPFDI